MPKPSVKTVVNNEFKLPRYLRLAKGAMWLDIDDENASGVRLYAFTSKLVGRGKIIEDKELNALSQKDIPKDKFGNNNFVNYGFVEIDVNEINWYVDTNNVPIEKQSRLILAYKHKILIEADPNKPPQLEQPKQELERNFETNKRGELIFVGKNKEIFKRLQNLSFNDLRDFISNCSKTEAGKNNLIDMYHYEVKGYNRLSRPRLEVIDLIRNKLKEFGPTMSSIRINDLE